jgi:hypothetical protein
VTRDGRAIAIRATNAGTEDGLFYRAQGLGIWRAEGVHFDGKLLFQRTSADAAPVVWASDFRELSIEGVVDVRSSAVISELVMSANRCAIRVDGDPSRVRIAARDGIQVVIND